MAENIIQQKSAKVAAAISPIDGDTLVQIAECDAADVDYTVRCPRDALARSKTTATPHHFLL